MTNALQDSPIVSRVSKRTSAGSVVPSKRRAQIAALETSLRERADAITDFSPQTEHYFAHGVYGRRFRMPAGQVVVGKIHRYPCVNVIAQGTVVVTSSTDDVPPGTRLTAGSVWVSKPGTCRAVLALEDAIWVTSHPNPSNTEDLDQLERELMVPTFEALEHQE